MTIQWMFGNAKNDKKEKLGNFKNHTASLVFTKPPDIKKDLDKALSENLHFRLHEAHERVKKQQKEKKKRPPQRQQGSLKLSNTDTMARARQVRARLLAKLSEVYGSDMDKSIRGAAAMDIKMQISRVDQQISAIRKRERAIEEERTTRRSKDTPENRRRRAKDIQEKRIYIRKDYLYHANKGGYDPNNPIFDTSSGANAASSVSFDISGDIGTMDIAADADLGADFNMEVVL